MMIARLFLALALLSAPVAHAEWQWTRKVIPGVDAVRTVEFGGGIFVAGTRTGYMLSSRDGVNWAVSRPAITPISDILYAKGRFYAVTAQVGNAKSKVLYSRDGVTWLLARRVSNRGRFASRGGLSLLAMRSGRFIALGPAETAFANSVNGTRWQNPLKGSKPRKYIGIATGLVTAGDFVVCSRQAGVTIQTSKDGLAWTTRVSRSARGLARGIAVQKPGNRLICVGDNGLSLVSGRAARNWRDRSRGSTNYLGITATPGLFAAFSDKAVFTTTSGRIWVRQLRINRNSDHLRAITAGNGLYVAAGYNGKNALLMVSAGVPAP